MKKTYIYIIILCLSIVAGFFYGCSDDDDNAVDIPDNSYITLFPFIEHERARVIGSYFESGDIIGVFIVPYEEDNTTPGSITTSTFAPNSDYVFNGSTWQISSGQTIYWPDRVRPVDMYAYYPYDVSLENTNSREYVFNVNADQRTKISYEHSDLLWARNLAVSPTREPVELSFSHLLSKVRVNIRSEIEEVNQQLDNAVVSVLNTRPQTTVDLAEGTNTVNNSSDLTDILAFHHSTPASGYRRSCEAIIIPQNISGGTPLISIDIPSLGSRYTYIHTEDILFERGTERTINITVTELGLSVAVGSISDWQDSEIIEGEIGTPIPKIVDLSNINWNTSRVHKIYDNGIQVGQVCREYLFKIGAGAIDAQAVVVYTMNDTGSVNETYGFAAQIMNRNRNSTTNEYEPNTSSIHGGYAAWDTNNNALLTYVTGSLPVVSKVEINGQSITAAPDNAITTLQTLPDNMIDVDGNSYSVVKIANQYWMAENLKTEHYNDGSPLLYYYFNDNIANKDIFGGLYIWNTIMDNRGIAPAGWRVPENTMFTSLYNYLNPNAGRKLKGNSLWQNLNYNDDVTGFNAIPGGRRTNIGTYNEIYIYGQWWSSTSTSVNDAYRLYLYSGGNAMYNVTLNKGYTQSVRLIRN